MNELVVRPGQIWGDIADLRELTLEHMDERYAYFRDLDKGRKSRIQLRRLQGKKYYLKAASPARYIEVPSETGACTCTHQWEEHASYGCRRCLTCKAFKAAKTYWVWTGDSISPAHCPCEDFRWHKREAGQVYHCKHLKLVLGEGGST